MSAVAPVSVRTDPDYDLSAAIETAHALPAQTSCRDGSGTQYDPPAISA